MRFFLLPLILFPTWCLAQCVTFSISSRGDTVNCTDKSGMKQGKWKNQVPSIRGNPGYVEEGSYMNGQKEGVWRTYSLMGDPLSMENYKYGMKHGLCAYFNKIGLEREERWRAPDTSKVYDTIDVPDLRDPNKVDQVIIKVEKRSLKHGIWRYYDSYTGKVIKQEEYLLDKLRMQSDWSNEALIRESDKPQPALDTIKVKPKEVLDYEKKNPKKKTSKERDGRTYYKESS
jgi:outer membrane protein assembly factor BamE (lipoprotein component of BamABCDE complex)